MVKNFEQAGCKVHECYIIVGYIVAKCEALFDSYQQHQTQRIKVSITHGLADLFLPGRRSILEGSLSVQWDEAVGAS